jgi:CheY-like chemotaxis protein
LAGGRNDPTDFPFQKPILCIDDDLAILCYEMELLESPGYEVLTASSAPQGLQLATTCKCDAVLLEYEMRGMKGQEVASKVPIQALALVDDFVPKLEANQQLLPIIAELCSWSEKVKHRQASIWRVRSSRKSLDPPLRAASGSSVLCLANTPKEQFNES